MESLPGASQMENKISSNQPQSDKGRRGEMLSTVVYINRSLETGPLVIWHLSVFELVRQTRAGKK